MRCASYCQGSGYKLDSLFDGYIAQKAAVKRYDEVLLVDLAFEKTICIFAYGAVVFWNFAPEEEAEELKFLKAYIVGKLAVFQEDTCKFEYSDETIIQEEEDKLVLHTNDSLLKLSLSYGLSQSVKLSAFEHEIDETIKDTRHFPAELAEKGKIALSRKKISQYIGKLFAQKNSINLDAYVLDTPEFFWKRPKYEAYYEMAVEYLDIRVRLNILNGKLDIIHEMYEILSNELKHAHSSFLEWVIILLILTEIILSILKDVLRWI
jgi:uncharacterized Rmd1/YagE family protein